MSRSETELNDRDALRGLVRWRGAIVLGAAGLIFISLMLAMYYQQVRVLDRVQLDEPGDATGRSVTRLDVVEVVRAMQLVTTQLDTRVRSEVSDQRWRGDVTAIVEAPVRYLYGVDLSNVRREHLDYNPLTRTYTLTIPPPRRLAVEVNGSNAESIIEVTGTRLRSRAGEYFLGLAREAVYAEARQRPLSPSEEARIIEYTREQVAGMMQLFLGEDEKVRVRFAEDE